MEMKGQVRRTCSYPTQLQTVYIVDKTFGQFKTSEYVAMESKEYHSMQTLLIEVWQYMEE